MKKLKELSVVIAALAVVTLLVFLRSARHNGFPGNAQEAVENIASSQVYIDTTGLKTAGFLVVDVSEKGGTGFENSVSVPFEKLADQSFLKQLKEPGKKILLVSSDASQAARAWVILNQLGVKNLYILADSEDPEILKYKFQPDTTARLESVSDQ